MPSLEAEVPIPKNEAELNAMTVPELKSCHKRLKMDLTRQVLPNGDVGPPGLRADLLRGLQTKLFSG